jgi:hypothetical protein
MTTQIQLVLEQLEDALVNRPEVLAAFYCGSVATGTYDPYSDIDLILIVSPQNRKAFFNRVPSILRRSVGLKSAVNNEAGDTEWCCLVTDQFIGLDVPVLAFADLAESHKFDTIRIIKDSRGRLARFRRRCQLKPVRLDRKKFLHSLEDIRNSQLYVARHVKQGRLLEAMSESTRLGEQLFDWLMKLKGIKYQPPTLRDAEKNLTLSERKLLLKTRPTRPTAAAVRNSMKAGWALTSHVIRLAEDMTGRKLPVSYDEAEFLDYVRAVYAGRKS